MTRVDFYVLEEAADATVTACRLAEKAYQRHQRVMIQAADAANAKLLDDRLWTFRQGSFVPHALLDSPDAEVAPVLVGTADPGRGCDQVLINLGAEVPLYFSRFERLAEIVPAGDESRLSGRARYRFYRDRGYPLAQHRIA